MWRFLIIFLVLGVLADTASAQVSDSSTFFSARAGQFRELLSNSDHYILIDVREVFEYRKSRIPGAVNVPNSEGLRMLADTASRETFIFLYCTTGFRSRRAARIMSDKGFKMVWSLDGGIKAWKKEGYRVEKRRRYKS